MEGCPRGVIVIIDHQPLTLLMQQQVLSWVQTRWIRPGFFQSIQPTIRYQPGKANILADALSKSKREDAVEAAILELDDQASDKMTVLTRSFILLTEEI